MRYNEIYWIYNEPVNDLGVLISSHLRLVPFVSPLTLVSAILEAVSNTLRLATRRKNEFPEDETQSSVAHSSRRLLP